MFGDNMKISNILSRRNRILLRELVVTDFKLRYQGSVLGYLWSLLKPLMLFAILYVVFVHFLRFGVGLDHFAVSLLLGIVLWSFFTEATSQGMQAIVGRGDLIRKINFPKYIIVISATISALINLLFNLVVVLVFMIIDGVDFKWTGLLFPLNVFELYIFSLAIAFWLSAAYVKYRDSSHIWEVFLQGLFYATPILYPLQMVVKFNFMAAQLLMLSPVAVILQAARYNLVSQSTTITNTQVIHNPFLLALPHVIVVLMVITAVYYFKKNQKYFAENV
jgi:ABC-2 type transport system permease protein